MMEYGQPERRKMNNGKKDKVLALLLSAIIPGSGQIYSGRKKRGVVILIGLTAVSFMITLYTCLVWPAVSLEDIMTMPIFFLALIGFPYSIQLLDAYRSAESYNESIGLDGID
ncbi:MAG: hypothetical protein A4E32_00032 [Methanomassiliicoccales archaeon PtaU1.Bin124]|nr:MAG: hypothetical protein A4E32_00032 [Methanomassiliicoccales archaeon PtaU1.Bin124]